MWIGSNATILPGVTILLLGRVQSLRRMSQKIRLLQECQQKL
ncbi:hypothetical protein [Lederbergia ruris]